MKFFTSKSKSIYEKPVLKIFSTEVPPEFEEKFPAWDKHLYKTGTVKASESNNVLTTDQPTNITYE